MRGRVKIRAMTPGESAAYFPTVACVSCPCLYPAFAPHSSFVPPKSKIPWVASAGCRRSGLRREAGR